MIIREISGSVLKNRFKMLLTKLEQVWDLYNAYKPLALQHNEIYRKLVKEKNDLVEDEDIREANKLIHDHNIYPQELKLLSSYLKIW